jgi:hypothetical protein
MRPYTIYQAFLLVPQNAIDRELCLRITNGKPACLPAGRRFRQKVQHGGQSRHGMDSVIVAVCNGGLPKRHTPTRAAGRIEGSALKRRD